MKLITRAFRSRGLAALLSLTPLLLVGCATPLAKERAQATTGIKSSSPITVSVIDDRPYVINNDKKGDFEGITRGAFGIPSDASRASIARTMSSNKFGYVDQPLADLFASMIAGALERNGNTARIERFEHGTNLEVIKRARKEADGKVILVNLIHSKVDIGFGASYAYNFKFSYITSDGISEYPVVGSLKTMSDFSRYGDISSSNIFDLLSLVYKDIIERGLQKIEQGLNQAPAK